MAGTYFTQVALVKNGIDNSLWIVLVSPKTGKRIAMPANYAADVVVCATTEALAGEEGAVWVELQPRDLVAFYNMWKVYDQMDYVWE